MTLNKNDLFHARIPVEIVKNMFTVTYPALVKILDADVLNDWAVVEVINSDEKVVNCPKIGTRHILKLNCLESQVETK